MKLLDSPARTLRPLFCAALVGTALLCSVSAQASHTSFLGAVDAIDFGFGPGGGSFTGSVAAVDDTWLTFDATAGDNLTLTFVTSNWFIDAVVLFDTGDGTIDIGDAVNVLNFNNNNLGLGTDLIIQHTDVALGGDNGYEVGGTLESLSLIAAFTGQYAIGITSANESQTAGFTATLSGNTGMRVPEPATALLLGLGLGGIGFAGRRRR